jgi:2-C-methyl-D-erythritol 4-phosphate cytidylyltransferase
VRYYFIVAAAGQGKRLGNSNPKQFLEYNGKALYLNVIEELEKNPHVSDIIVLTREEYIKKVENDCVSYKKVKKVLCGGKERQDSIYNAIKYIKKICEPQDIIGVQDGARPFIRQDYISKTYKKLLENKDYAGIVVGVPVKDTIKIVDIDKNIQKTPKRDLLFAAQTPQIFYSRELIEAYEKAEDDKYYGTDDSSLLERIGKKVLAFEGSYDNIKITTAEDLVYIADTGN